MQNLNLNQKSNTSKNEVMFVVRNHVEEDELSVCLPLSSKRAGSVEKAKEEFKSIIRYFQGKISETLVLYQKVGIDENGRDKYEKIAGCVVHNGHRELVEFTSEAIIS